MGWLCWWVRKCKGCDHGIFWLGITGLQTSWDTSLSDEGEDGRGGNFLAHDLAYSRTDMHTFTYQISLRLEPSQYCMMSFSFPNWHIRHLLKTSSQFYKSPAKKNNLEGKAEAKIIEQTFCLQRMNILFLLKMSLSAKCCLIVEDFEVLLPQHLLGVLPALLCDIFRIKNPHYLWQEN